MAVRAVVFDAMGTLIEPCPDVADVYQSALRNHCNINLATDQISSALKQALQNRSADHDLQTSEDAEFAFWDQFIRGLTGDDRSGRQACFDELFEHFGQPTSWRCFDDVAETLQLLIAQGLTIAIASNFDRRLHSVLDGMSQFNAVPHRIVSSEVGWRKPSANFFDAVFRCVDMPASDVLMVGDDLTNDVIGALQSECQAAWICRRPDPCETPPGSVRLDQLTDLPPILIHRQQVRQRE